MKKVLSVALVLVVLLMGTACEKIIMFPLNCIANDLEETRNRKEAAFVASFETDGVLLYYYYLNGLDKHDKPVFNESDDIYCVVGTVDNKEDMTIYVPPYFNGKPIHFVGYEYPVGYSYNIYQIPDQKRVYLPYTLKETGLHAELKMKESFACDERCVLNYEGLWFYDYSAKIYMPGFVFEKDLLNRYSEQQKEKVFVKIADYYAEWTTGVLLFIANTSFLFNYEDAPNNNYFL